MSVFTDVFADVLWVRRSVFIARRAGIVNRCIGLYLRCKVSLFEMLMESFISSI